MKYKLNAEIRAKLIIEARKLRVVKLNGKQYTRAIYIETDVLIASARIIDVGVYTRESALKALGLTESSYVSVTIEMDHLKNLKKRYKKGGMKAVDAYISKYKAAK